MAAGQRGAKTNFLKQNTNRIGVGELAVNWRGQRGPKPNFLKRHFTGETCFVPAFFLTLDLFRITGYEGEKLLSAVPQPC